MNTTRKAASDLRGIADEIWEVMRKEHTLSDGARAALGRAVADIEDVIEQSIIDDWNNGVNPDEIIKRYDVTAERVYQLVSGA